MLWFVVCCANAWGSARTGGLGCIHVAIPRVCTTDVYGRCGMIVAVPTFMHHRPPDLGMVISLLCTRIYHGPGAWVVL